MAPKRPASTNASPMKTKKRKEDDNSQQQRLTTFFGAGGSPAKAPAKGKGKAKVVEEVEIIDVDADDENDIEVVRVPKIGEPAPSGPQSVRATTNNGLPEPKDTVSLSETYVSPTPEPLAAVSSTTPKTARPVFGAALAKGASKPVTYPDLSVDPMTFDLSACPWTTSSAPYAFLTHAFVTLSSTRSRIVLVNTLVNTLRLIIKYDSKSLLAALYLLSNSISPAYEPTEMNIGPNIISKGLQSVSGLSSNALRKLYNTLGDPGDVAFEAKSSLRTLAPHPPLLIQGTYDSLLRIARSKGNGAMKEKQAIVERLLLSAKGEESRYLVRTFAQHLRVGAVRTTMITALSRALVLTRPPNPTPPKDSDVYATPNLLKQVQPLDTAKSKKKNAPSDSAWETVKEMYIKAEALLKKVFVQHPNYGHIVAAILEHGFENLPVHVPLTVGVPLHCTLGSPTRSLDEIYDRLGELPFTAEFKYDGQRVQMHASRSTLPNEPPSIKLFSRNLEDMTDKYPDILSLIQRLFDQNSELSSFIIDAEVVAVDPTNGDIKSFQELSNRPKRDVNLHEVKVVVCVYVFDLMYLNGKVLLGDPFRTRRDVLRSTFAPYTPEDKYTARLAHVQNCESSEGREVVEEFFQMAVASKSEGLMVKLLDNGEIIDKEEEDVNLSASPKKGKGKSKGNRKPLPATYEPDKRTFAWMKLKKDYVQGLGDTFDLVPVGAWHGNGRKVKWWSPVLMAIWDHRSDKLVAVCKCMSGFTDAFYKEMAERYKEGSDTCARQPFPGIPVEFGDLRPSVYFKPSEVWELQGADITISPRSVAALGLVSDIRGLSIRFPRFLRIRDDKSLEDASGPDLLADLYRKQETRNGEKRDVGGADDGDLIDVDLEDDEDLEEDNEDI